MPKTVDFYFDFGSPAAYLASTQLVRLQAETGALVRWCPMLLGGVFVATGNTPPISVPAKGRYIFTDFARHAKRYGVPLQKNPFFPLNTINLMRMATALQMDEAPRFNDFAHAMFAAIWQKSLNLSDPATVAQVLTQHGFDATAMLARATEARVKDQLRVQTEAAVARGVFGAPTFFVGTQMFWGQDRLDFVRDALLQTPT